MALEDIIKEIDADVADVASSDFSYTTTFLVPNSHDAGLTFERNTVKQGKQIETCVLFVDIRNSVILTRKHQSITMGRIYTAFIKAVIKIGRHHNASTRNIIGDRVMLVFPVKDCFNNAIECAISINHIASKVINKRFTNVDFKCGIGVDYGALKVIKVGIQRNGTEKSESKGLVWTGYPANLASRLTDVAHKKFEDGFVNVDYKPVNYSVFFRKKPSLFDYLETGFRRPSFYLDSRVEKFSESEFAKSLSMKSDGKLSFNKGELISFEHKVETYNYPAILFTDRVKVKLTKHINIWKEQKRKIENVDAKVFGGSPIWKIG